MNLSKKLGIIISAIAVSSTACACEIKMAYKDKEKLPLIEDVPSDEGAYKDLFTKAAESIGCKLEIVRIPKKRLHSMLESGDLDFYPGASFSTKRANYLYYFPNGFMSGQYGITPKSVKEVFSFNDVKSQNLMWYMEPGGSKNEIAKDLGIEAREISDLNIDSFINYVKRDDMWPSFYVADKELVDYFHKKTGKSIDSEGFKIQKDCCGGEHPMYAGFSRKSAHFSEKTNPDYDPNQALSPDNFPTVIDDDCVANKLRLALESMEKNGETDKIYQEWFN